MNNTFTAPSPGNETYCVIPGGMCPSTILCEGTRDYCISFIRQKAHIEGQEAEDLPNRPDGFYLEQPEGILDLVLIKRAHFKSCLKLEPQFNLEKLEYCSSPCKTVEHSSAPRDFINCNDKGWCYWRQQDYDKRVFLEGE